MEEAEERGGVMHTFMVLFLGVLECARFDVKVHPPLRPFVRAVGLAMATGQRLLVPARGENAPQSDLENVGGEAVTSKGSKPKKWLLTLVLPVLPAFGFQVMKAQNLGSLYLWQYPGRLCLWPALVNSALICNYQVNIPLFDAKKSWIFQTS